MAASNTPLSLTIPSQGFDELAAITAHAARLPDVIEIASAFPLNVSLEEASSEVSKRTGIDRGTSARIVNGLTTLRGLMGRVQANAAELVRGLSYTIQDKATKEWQNAHQQRWEESRDAVESALASIPNDHPLVVRQKAKELTYAHQNIFRSCRIITDLRPVFDDSGEKINAVVLTHVLSIEYSDGVRRQQIDLALDTVDVENLRKASSRAEEKTRTTRKAFAGDQWSLIVAGEPSPTGS